MAHTLSWMEVKVNGAIVMLLACAALLPQSALPVDDSAQYSDVFRRWVHVGTGVILPGTNPNLTSEEGMHHIFANMKAVEGYSSGNFADGSIIVYELRDSQQKNGVIFEGDRKRVDVMIKDSTAYKETGGWRFERFWGTDHTRNEITGLATTCFQCHSKASGHGFVFSHLN